MAIEEKFMTVTVHCNARCVLPFRESFDCNEDESLETVIAASAECNETQNR